jgi:hypothetical protein
MKESVLADGTRSVDPRDFAPRNWKKKLRRLVRLGCGTRRERADIGPPVAGHEWQVMDGNNRLPVGTGNEDFEVEGSRNGLIADHAGDEAVLAYSSEDACVHTRTGRLHDLKIRGPTSLIDNHAYNDLAVIVKQASSTRRIGYDINFVDQLGSDDSG